MAGVTETILLAPWQITTLAAGIRAINANGIASRLELKPQSTFAGDPEFDSTSLSDWTQANSANADTIDANTTRKSNLYINLNATNSQRPNNSPFVYQVKSGDFDVYTRVRQGDLLSFHHAAISAQDTATATRFMYVYLYHNGVNSIRADLFDSVNGDNTVAVATDTMFLGSGDVCLRLARVGNTFTGYYSLDGKTWTSIASRTNASFSSGANLGLSAQNYNTSNRMACAFDFIRTWPPYLTTSPVASGVIDSGFRGTVWTPSTFAALENPYSNDAGLQAQIGYGTLKYRMAAGETDPPTLSGSANTEAQIQALAAITGRYLNVEVTLISANGYELPVFAGAKLNRTLPRRVPRREAA